MFAKMNDYAAKGMPFVFVIDFDIKKGIVMPFADAFQKNILFDIHGMSNFRAPSDIRTESIKIDKLPVSFERYKKAFDYVHKNLSGGNSYLVNLTFPTRIKINAGLKDIFYRSMAGYRLYYKDKFIVFSPECFVKIRDKMIYTYPMKGTIDAAVKNAGQKILDDEKEYAEHITVVDLLRNDLGMVSKNVEVTKFRYIDELKTNDKTLLQVSSEIRGELPDNYGKNIGNIIRAMLPAGSVTGAPKKKTVEIIKKAEGYKRGFYTGIFGYFDGSVLDSAVMIRYIEKNGNRYYYKSGGGITVYSDTAAEYREMIDKVYVPVY